MYLHHHLLGVLNLCFAKVTKLLILQLNNICRLPVPVAARSKASGLRQLAY